MSKNRRCSPRRLEVSSEAEIYARRIEIGIDQHNWAECRRVIDEAQRQFESPSVETIDDDAWLAELGLSVRIVNLLERSGVYHVSQLAVMREGDVLAIRGISVATVGDIRQAMENAGVRRTHPDGSQFIY